MLHGRDIVCISSIDWDAHWQIHHQIASSLVAAGNRVLFVENTGVRAPGVRDLSRMRQRVSNWWRSTKGFREVTPGLFVYSPLFLPFPYSIVARWFNRTVMFRGLTRWLTATDFRRPIAWTFLPTPTALDLVAALDSAAVVYYCADDFAATSPGARRVAKSEDAMLRRADLVFVTSERLREKASRVSRHVHAFPAGVDYDMFDAVRQATDNHPPDLAALPRPVAGYVGALHVWLDQDLMAQVAAKLPEATFAFVGPAQVNVERLTNAPNVRLLGPRAHDQVPAYIKGFDVALVPYLRSEFTDSVYPVKLNEYLAMGVPVVATDLPEIRRFNERHGDVLAVARDAAEFAACVKAAMAAPDADLAERRRAVAEQNSWHHRLEEMSALVEAAIRRREHDGRGWEQRLKRLYSRARRRGFEAAAAAVVVYALLFQTPLVWWFAEPLRLDAPPQRADVVAVFAAGVGESGEAGGGHQERVKHAVDLYKAGMAPRMIFSSGYVFAFREAEVMKALAMASGVPEAAIVLEQDASNTREMAERVGAIMAHEGWRTALLVSSPYHMQRAVKTWRRLSPATSVVPAPVPQSQFYA
ncbi:MAG: ElyC/SanA/YdcF family protein, partial [Acidobacteriota bacterium]